LFAATRTQVTSLVSGLLLLERELRNRIKHANSLSIEKERRPGSEEA